MRVVKGAYLADRVVVTGDVVLGAEVNLWYGVVVRGDLARITLGDAVNIQDGCLLHTDFEASLTIAPGVVAGHAAVLHGASIGEDTLVGIGARLLGGTEIGPECLIAAGSVVAQGTRVPPRSVVMGIPGRVVRQTTVDEVAKTRAINARYLEMARRYAEGRVERPYGG
jgi:carbonic anhydrase/acetyltransferase-like protein (isoleucine patch superfamily)